MTTGIPGLACSERALPRSLPASPLLPQPKCPVTCILQLSSPRKDHFSTLCQAPKQSGRWRLRDKGALDSLSEAGMHVRNFKSAILKGTQGAEKGCSHARGQTGLSRPWGTPGMAGRQTVVHATASMLDTGVAVGGLVTAEEESTEQTLSHSRMNHFYSYLQLQLTGICPARPFKCIAFPYGLL